MILRATKVLGVWELTVEKGVEHLLEFFPSLGIDAVAHAVAFNLALDDAELFEFAQMLAYGSLGESEFLHQFVVDAGAGGKEVFNNGNAGGMGKGFKGLGLLVLFLSKEIGSGGPHAKIIYCNITINR